MKRTALICFLAMIAASAVQGPVGIADLAARRFEYRMRLMVEDLRVR